MGEISFVQNSDFLPQKSYESEVIAPNIKKKQSGQINLIWGRFELILGQFYF